MALSMSDTVGRSLDQVAAEVDGEVVMMSIAKGSYYGLDGVGSRIWGLLEIPCRLSVLCDALRAEYAVDAIECERDLLAFTEQLLAEGLIEVMDDTAD